MSRRLFVAGRRDDHGACPESLPGADLGHDRVEHPQVAAVGLERVRGGEVDWPAVVGALLYEAREVEAQRHRDDARSVVDGPADAAKHHLGATPALVAEDLADEGARDAARDSDALAVEIAAEDRPGAVGAMSLPVPATAAGEVLLDELDPFKGGMLVIYPRVQNGDSGSGSGEL